MGEGIKVKAQFQRVDYVWKIVNLAYYPSRGWLPMLDFPLLLSLTFFFRKETFIKFELRNLQVQ